ncbi:hypothetical protein D9611_013797 [Ephemerocybe angulata]|uniref:DUF6533 domain-containing protein n=1 Tax=Ephemerocybe angulata TaxID=980116 RepID=A0A8H5C4R1_9AGAR|nr:hypothetical protein D9611_013797 [Tulosesus angulatus]
MIQPNEFQAVAASLHRILIRKYTDVAAFTYFLLEYIETVDAEVKYIWAERLSIVKVLFFGSRYIPFITVPLLLRFANGHLFTPEVAHFFRMHLVITLTLFGLAMLGSQWGHSTLVVDQHHMRRCHRFPSNPGLGEEKKGHGDLPDATFHIGPSPLPDQVPCYLAQRDVRTMVIPFFLLLFNITSACLLSICLVLLNYRHSKSPFIKILYIDGTYHFVLMAATTTGNAALWLAASYEYRFLLLAQRPSSGPLDTRIQNPSPNA